MIPVDTVIIGIKASCQPFFEAISSAIAVVTDFGKVAWKISSGSPKTFPNIYKMIIEKVLPKTVETRIGNQFLFNIWNCSYKATPIITLSTGLINILIILPPLS